MAFLLAVRNTLLVSIETIRILVFLYLLINLEIIPSIPIDLQPSSPKVLVSLTPAKFPWLS